MNKTFCQNNPDHTRFVAYGQVSKLWIVDDEGNYIEDVEKPNPKWGFTPTGDHHRERGLVCECGGAVGETP